METENGLNDRWPLLEGAQSIWSWGSAATAENIC